MHIKSIAVRGNPWDHTPLATLYCEPQLFPSAGPTIRNHSQAQATSKTDNFPACCTHRLNKTPDLRMVATWPENIDHSLWRDAEKIVQDSENLHEIESVCNFILDPQVAVMILCRRPDRTLHRLCQRKNIVHQDKRFLAKAFVASIRGSSVSDQIWDVDWIIPAILSAEKGGPKWIANELDTQIHSALCMIPFSDLILFSITQETSIPVFDTMSHLYNELARHVTVDGVAATLRLLLQEVQHPLSRWIVSYAIENITYSHWSPKPSNALHFVLEPIRMLFEGQSSVPQVLKELRILEARFELRVNDRRMLNQRTLDDTPLSAELKLWDSIHGIHGNGLDVLARHHTDCVLGLFSKLSAEDVLNNLDGLGNISKDWVGFTHDISVCLAMDGSLSNDFMELAKRFLELQNVHSATAVGKALWDSNFRCPQQWLTAWGVINPEGNFAGCRLFMDGRHCLPSLMPYSADLRGNLSQIFCFVGYIGRVSINEQNVALSSKRPGVGGEQKIDEVEVSVWKKSLQWRGVWNMLSMKTCMSRR